MPKFKVGDQVQVRGGSTVYRITRVYTDHGAIGHTRYHMESGIGASGAYEDELVAYEKPATKPTEEEAREYAILWAREEAVMADAKDEAPILTRAIAARLREEYRYQSSIEAQEIGELCATIGEFSRTLAALLDVMGTPVYDDCVCLEQLDEDGNGHADNCPWLLATRLRAHYEGKENTDGS